MFGRKVANILLGSASTTDLMITAVLAGMLGFIPGFLQAPGLIILLTILLLLFNCNLLVASLVILPAKLVSLTLTPITFAAGRFFLDGPTQGFFIELINAPVLALFGFEYYLTVPGLLFGGMTGFALGYLLTKVVSEIRSKLADAEINSEAYNKIVSSGSGRFFLYVIMGGMSPSGYQALLHKKSMPIRPAGVVLILLFIVITGGGAILLSGSYAGSILKDNLEAVNGATVDLGSTELDLFGGSFSIFNLAVADPNALETDLFRAGQVTMDISSADLLRKRIRIDRVDIHAASHGLKRDVPGVLVGDGIPDDGSQMSKAEGESLDDYIADADVWRQRLGQAKKWFDRLNNAGLGQLIPGDIESGNQQEGLSLEAWIDRQIEMKGYAGVMASHLIEESPTVRCDRLSVENLTTTLYPGETVDILVTDLSTQPHLISSGPSLTAKSSGGTMNLSLALNGVSKKGGVNDILFELKDLKVDELKDLLLFQDDENQISGGTVDIRLQGNIEDRDGAWIDLLLSIILHNSEIKIKNQKLPVDQLELPVQLKGPLDRPRVIVDKKKLTSSLSRLLEDSAKSKAKKAVKKKIDKVKDSFLNKLRRKG